ncbi:ankyrin [Aspergillus costaricaensis CBS 115574]|uniref:Ankyrin n=1 Tax=Aspergillus costaricaensis CBS 115574 TaxID=1448317 RepID=A0ACD1ICN6_9EURO|nr:ankyrin [Aspergillus costaricaensis CBS 115574]RAK88041.1 ankyrin [Aspergillus costaricaensis CBS 115574]
MTPLHYAAQLLPPGYWKGREKWNSLLKGLELDDLNEQDEDGRTPLSYAAELGDAWAVKKLIEAGADPYRCDKNGRSVLSWAAQFGHETLIELLSWDVEFSDDKDNQGWTPCHYFLQCFLQSESHSTKGYDLRILPLIWDRSHSRGVRGLSLEVKHRHWGIWTWTQVPSKHMKASMLSEHDAFGLTLLARAVRLERYLIVKVLLTIEGINIGVADRDGKTPLWWAIEARNRDIAELLWDDDDTTLRLLARNAHTRSEHLEWLVTNDYSFARLQGPNKENAFHIMLDIPNIGVMEHHLQQIITRVSDLPTDTVEAPTYTRSGSLVEILEKADRRGLTPLALAKEKRLLPIVKLFLRCRAKVDCFKHKADWFNILPDSKNMASFCNLEETYRNVSFELVRKKNNILVFDFYQAEDVTPQGHLVERCDMLQHLCSTISHGQIPASDDTFLQQYIGELFQEWSLICDEIETHIIDHCNGDETSATVLITDLADDSRYLATIQKALQDQVKGIQKAISEYRRVDVYHSLRLQEAEEGLGQLKATITDRLDKQHERVRDLRQMFIFLPLMFASSLFGMNVNALQSNPDWRWYIVLGAASLLLTYALWKVSDQNVRISQIWSELRSGRAMKNKTKDCEG